MIRQPRLSEVRPTVVEPAPVRHPQRLFSFPFIFLSGFVLLIVAGGLLLALPIATIGTGKTRGRDVITP